MAAVFWINFFLQCCDPRCFMGWLSYIGWAVV
jgi:hypothetical protein